MSPLAFWLIACIGAVGFVCVLLLAAIVAAGMADDEAAAELEEAIRRAGRR